VEIYTSLANEQVPNLKSLFYINFIENDRASVESEAFKQTTPICSGVEVLYLPRDFYNRLNELAKQHNATLFHLLLGAMSISPALPDRTILRLVYRY
jgi:diphthamide biosynthesis methyltransferase